MKLSIRANIIWNSLGNTIYLALQWLLTIVIARITDYNQLGLYSLAMSITHVGFSICSWGVRNYQISDIRQKYKWNEYVTARFATCILGCSIIAIFTLTQDYSYVQIVSINIYMLFRAFESIIDVAHGIFQQESRMDFIGISYITRGILNFIVMIIILYLTENIVYAIIGTTISTLFILLLMDYRYLYKLKSRYFVAAYKKVCQLIWDCMPLAIQHILFTSYASIPKIFLEKIHGQELLGIYASITIPVVIIQSMANFIIIPFATIMSDYAADKDKYNLIRIIKMIICGIIIIGLTVGSILLLTGDKILYFLYGSEVSCFSDVLLPCLIAVLLIAFDSLLNILLIIFRQKKGLLFANFCSILITLCLADYLIESFSLYGASYLNIITLLIHFIITFIFLIKELNKLNSIFEN